MIFGAIHKRFPAVTLPLGRLLRIVILLMIAPCQALNAPHSLQLTEKTIPMRDSRLQGIMTQKAKIEIGEEILGKSPRGHRKQERVIERASFRGNAVS